jgi:hypothetical protein
VACSPWLWQDVGMRLETTSCRIVPSLFLAIFTCSALVQTTETKFPTDCVGVSLTTTRNLRRYAKGMQCLLGQLHKFAEKGSVPAQRLIRDGIRIPNTCRLEGTSSHPTPVLRAMQLFVPCAPCELSWSKQDHVEHFGTHDAGMFGAARYGRGHNIASMDGFAAAKAMERMGQHFVASAVKQQRKHYCREELTRQRQAQTRADKGAKEDVAGDTDDSADSNWDEDSSSSSSSSSSRTSDSSSDLEAGSEGDRDMGEEEDDDNDGEEGFLSASLPRPSRRRAGHAALSLQIAAAGARKTALLSGDGDEEEEEEGIGESTVQELAARVAAAANNKEDSAAVHALAIACTDFVLSDCKRVFQHVVKRGGHLSGSAPTRVVMVAYSKKVATATINTADETMNEASMAH